MTHIMPVNQIVIPTSKWQVTIPKTVREKVGLERQVPLNVSQENGRIVMVPIKLVIKESSWNEERRKKLLKALAGIKGIWANDKDFEKRETEKEKIEIEAAKRMRKAW